MHSAHQHHHHHHHQLTQQQPQHALKRRPSEEMGGGPGNKKFILAGPWDLEIPTNIILFEKQPSMLSHPHPDVEVLRFTFLMKLRQSYQEMCHSRCVINALWTSISDFLCEINFDKKIFVIISGKASTRQKIVSIVGF